MFVFGREETADKSLSGGASVAVTGAGGNGFGVRCDLLHPQMMYKVREKVIKATSRKNWPLISGHFI